MDRSSWSSHKSMYDFEAALGRLNGDTRVCAENKQATVRFTNTLLAQGYSTVRLVKISYCLRYMGGWVGKPFEQATKDDLIALIGWIERQGYAEHSKYDFKVVLKMFYRWLKGNSEVNPPETAWLKPRRRQCNNKLPEDLLTEEEVRRMAQFTNNPRDRAIILVLYETGCRIGEILSLTLKNVSFDQHGAILKVSGKTGDRRVRVIGAVPELAEWMKKHPDANNPNAPLWPTRRESNHPTNRGAEYGSIYVLIQDLARKAQLNKKVHPHLFRHSRATFLASKLTEAQMKDYLGWTQGSKMAATYVHMSGREVDDTLIKLFGERDQHKKCVRCQENNLQNSKYCSRCGNQLEVIQALPPILDNEVSRNYD